MASVRLQRSHIQRRRIRRFPSALAWGVSCVKLPSVDWDGKSYFYSLLPAAWFLLRVRCVGAGLEQGEDADHKSRRATQDSTNTRTPVRGVSVGKAGLVISPQPLVEAAQTW